MLQVEKTTEETTWCHEYDNSAGSTWQRGLTCECFPSTVQVKHADVEHNHTLTAADREGLANPLSSKVHAVQGVFVMPTTGAHGGGLRGIPWDPAGGPAAPRFVATPGTLGEMPGGGADIEGRVVPAAVDRGAHVHDDVQRQLHGSTPATPSRPHAAQHCCASWLKQVCVEMDGLAAESLEGLHGNPCWKLTPSECGIWSDNALMQHVAYREGGWDSPWTDGHEHCR
jgi:hypothetical protein